MSLPLLIIALLLFVFGIVIVAGRWAMRWRAALFCGVAAFWLWNMALGLAAFARAGAGLRGIGGVGDPSAVAKGVGDALIHGSQGCLLCVPLLMVSALAFFVHKDPR